MKEWIVIHKIKSLYDNGNGLTERKIAKELGISRNTVSKYLKMPEPVISEQLSKQTEPKNWMNTATILFIYYKPIPACRQ